jgi:hypothetical protein
MDIGPPPGPDFFLFSDTAESARRLTAAGFHGVDKIKADVASNLTEYRAAHDYHIPMPVVIASAAKP